MTPFPVQTVPPAWRALGYMPFGDLVSLSQEHGEPEPVIRKLWAAGLLPQPDVIVASGDTRTSLPGWTQETIESWIQRETTPIKEWMPGHRIFDLRVAALAADNRANKLGTGAELGGEPIQTLGYNAAAAYITSLGLLNDKGKPISMSGAYLRLVWRQDLTRGYHAVAPIPDVILTQGSRRTQLPGWTQETLRNWPQTRQTPGNWSYGDQRAKRKVDLPDQRELTGQAT